MEKGAKCLAVGPGGCVIVYFSHFDDFGNFVDMNGESWLNWKRA